MQLEKFDSVADGSPVTLEQREFHFVETSVMDLLQDTERSMNQGKRVLWSIQWKIFHQWWKTNVLQELGRRVSRLLLTIPTSLMNVHAMMTAAPRDLQLYIRCSQAAAPSILS